jgi:hypothetical protein
MQCGIRVLLLNKKKDTPQRKRHSTALVKAERRLEGVQSISPTLDLGNELSASNYHERNGSKEAADTENEKIGNR